MQCGRTCRIGRCSMCWRASAACTKSSSGSKSELRRAEVWLFFDVCFISFVVCTCYFCAGIDVSVAALPLLLFCPFFFFVLFAFLFCALSTFGCGCQSGGWRWGRKMVGRSSPCDFLLSMDAFWVLRAFATRCAASPTTARPHKKTNFSFFSLLCISFCH